MKNAELAEKIAEFITQKAAAKIGDLEKRKEKTETSIEMADDSEKELLEEIEKKKEQFKAANWLSAAARRAGQLQAATHVLKFSHTSAEGSSIYAFQEKSAPTDVSLHGLISTTSLTTIDSDYVGNAAALDVVKLLSLREGDTTLIDLIKLGDMSAFAPFAENVAQLEEWRKGFMALWNNDEPASHSFSKQVYFPVGKEEYHLISPLHASSLAHEIYKKIRDSRYSEQAKIVRQAKRESKYHPSKTIDYPNVATQAYGGTKPQNVSQLNSIRGGEIFLLSCAPPTWEKQNTPLLNAKTIFSRWNFGQRVRKEIFRLREYLESTREKPSTKIIRDFRAEQIDLLIDELVQYGAEIRDLRHLSGWSASAECKLPRSQQLWLDPGRSNDELFSLELEKGDWREALADQFAQWLNRSLQTKNLHFADVEHLEWKSLLERKLRLLKKYLEVF